MHARTLQVAVALAISFASCFLAQDAEARQGYVLIDASSSMSGYKLKHSLGAASFLKWKLGKSMDTTVFAVHGKSGPEGCNPVWSRFDVENEASALRPHGCSPIAKTIDDFVRRQTRANEDDIVIFITDAHDSEFGDMASAVARAKKHGVYVVLVGFRRESNWPALKRAAEAIDAKIAWWRGDYLPAEWYADVYEGAIAPRVPAERVPASQKVAVAETGRQTNIVATPVRETMRVGVATRAKPVAASGTGRISRNWAWAVIGLGAITTGAGGYLGYSAKEDFRNFKTKPMYSPGYTSERDNINRKWITADVLYGVSAVVISAGITWLLWPESDDEE